MNVSILSFVAIGLQNSVISLSNSRNSYFTSVHNSKLHKSTQPFIYSSSEMSQIFLKKSEFKSFLSPTIYLESIILMHQNFNSRYEIAGFNANIQECTFRMCFANKPKEYNCGGGLYAQLGFISKTSIIITRSSFDRCSALSSGGALFITASFVKLSACCVKRCTAEKNQACYVYSSTFASDYCTFSLNGFTEDESSFYSRRTTFGLGSGRQVVSSTNFSHNLGEAGNTFITDISPQEFHFIYSHFSKSIGEGGFSFENGEGNITHCFIANNSFKRASLFETDSKVLVEKCFLILKNNRLFSEKSSKYIHFGNCKFDISYNEMKARMFDCVEAECQYSSTFEFPTLILQENCYDYQFLKDIGKIDISKYVIIIILLVFLYFSLHFARKIRVDSQPHYLQGYI